MNTRFTKEEAKRVYGLFDEIFSLLSKNKKVEYIGEANDIYLFLKAAESVAPSEAGVEEKIE